MASGSGWSSLCARTPAVEAGEQEQPHHVDEVPVPGAELEAEMLLGREVAEIGADQAHDQEGRSDDHMCAMEASGHKEGGAVDVPGIVETGVAVFVGLHGRESEAQENGADQAPLQALTVVLEQRMVRPGHRSARGEQDQRVEQRQMPGIEGLYP